MLASAHQGYIYQDILGAYLVAQELANGRGATTFIFDKKKTPKNVPDKFDDLAIYQQNKTTFLQVKYSNDANRHALTKNDFASKGTYDLALVDLFDTWKSLHKPGYNWRVCLAWDSPAHDDAILEVLVKLPDSSSLVLGTSCYKFSCEKLWPVNESVSSSWRVLKNASKSIDRTLFEDFLNCLVIEVDYPKSSLLEDYTKGIERLLYRAIEDIGIGVYPNDHLTPRSVAESLCNITNTLRATVASSPISCQDIAKRINIIQDYGGIEQHFPIDETVLVKTPDRLEQVIDILEKHRTVILTAEPGSGKSWFINNLEKHIKETTEVVKHYCYTALEDPLTLKRIKVNTLYGNLITQLIQIDPSLGSVIDT